MTKDINWIDELENAIKDFKSTIIMMFLFVFIGVEIGVSVLLFPVLGFSINGNPLTIFFYVCVTFSFLFIIILNSLITDKAKIKKYRKLAYPNKI